TPYEALHGRPPVLTGLPVWGSRVWVHDTSTGKVGERAKPANWVGYDAQSKGHRVYWPDARRITVERNLEGEDVPNDKLEESASDGASEHEDVPDEPHTPPMPPKSSNPSPPPTP
ncbi:hypothetical protein DAEQUDRAFT_640400, partial [Daedalea quercina L-15889]